MVKAGGCGCGLGVASEEGSQVSLLLDLYLADGGPPST